MSRWVGEIIVVVFIILLGIVTYVSFRYGIKTVASNIWSKLISWVSSMDNIHESTTILPMIIHHPVMAAHIVTTL